MKRESVSVDKELRRTAIELAAIPMHEACEHAVETLHDFFAAWYCGERDRDAFDTVERALADSFERVSPGGAIDTRAEILDSVRGAYGNYEPGEFEIEIRNVEPIDTTDDRVLVRYEEWQTSPSGTNGRLSTALFAPLPTDSEEVVEWCYLHETWLDPPG